MTQFTKEWHEAYERRQREKRAVNLANNGSWPCTIFQEPKERGDRKEEGRIDLPDVVDAKGGKGQKGGDYSKFEVSVTFHMSDNRRRDLDGGIATILDALCSARRLLAGDPIIKSKRPVRKKG